MLRNHRKHTSDEFRLPNVAHAAAEHSVLFCIFVQPDVADRNRGSAAPRLQACRSRGIGPVAQAVRAALVPRPLASSMFSGSASFPVGTCALLAGPCVWLVQARLEAWGLRLGAPWPVRVPWAARHTGSHLAPSRPCGLASTAPPAWRLGVLASWRSRYDRWPEHHAARDSTHTKRRRANNYQRMRQLT